MDGSWRWSRWIGALAVALALLWAATLDVQAAPAAVDAPQCADFEDLAVGAQFAAGATFTSGPHDFAVREFIPLNGTPIAGNVTVADDQAAGGNGHDLAVNNANLELLLPADVAGVYLNAGYYGGGINLMVNDDLHKSANLTSLDGQIVGGALVRVVAKPGDPTKHLLKVRGAVASFSLGGQELFVDNVCVPAEGAPGGDEVGAFKLQKSIQGDPVEVQAGDVMTYVIRVAHEGGSAPMQVALSDTLPVGVVLARPISVTEVSGLAGPVRAAFGDGSVRWKGGLAPDSVLEIAIPVRVKTCYGPEPRTLTNTVTGRHEGGAAIQASVAVKVACGDINLDNLKVEVAVEAWGDHDAELHASGVLTHWPGPLTATVRGGFDTLGRVRITVRNQNSAPAKVGLSFTYEKITWAYDAQPPTQAAAAMSGPHSSAPLIHLPPLELGPGEEKSVYHVINLAELDAGMVAQATGDPFPELETGFQVRSVYSFEDECGPACRARDDGQFTRRSLPWLIRWFTQDLGDAPDNTNHAGAAGAGMTAYPGVPANFPTVFDPATGPVQGPRHYHPRPLHLGSMVSWEGEADLGPDQDGVNNIRPTANFANLDRFDDGVNPAAWTLQHCRETRIPVRVFISPQIAALFAQVGQKASLNVWIDGDRNGDWAGSVQCPPADNLPPAALEHIVIDHPVDVALLGPGLHTLIVPTGRVPWPAESAARPAWVRVTLSERPANKTLTSFGIAHGDGRGYAAPFRFGETEDYLWRAPADPVGVDVAVRKQGKLFQQYDAETGKVVSRIAWTIEYRNQGDVTANGVVLRDRLDEGRNIIAILIGIRAPTGVSHTVDGETLVFQIGELPPGAKGAVIILTDVYISSATSIAEEPPTDKLINLAEIRAEGDVNLANNTARAQVDIGLRAPRILTPIDGATCANEVVVTGRAPGNASVDIYVDGVLASTVVAAADGRWQTTVDLPDGTHILTATAKLGSIVSEPSPAVEVIVDSLLAWDPISLRFMNARGHVIQPADADGRLDASGWTVSLHPNATYTVSVRICCGDPNAQVTLSGVSTDTVVLDDPDADGVYVGVFRTGPRGSTDGAVTLTVVCANGEASANGAVELIDPAGVVYDITTGALLADATVACMEAQTSVADGSTAFSLWDAAGYGQVNPQVTAADGYFSFFTPVGTYQVDVVRSGYQPYRSPDLVVISEPVYYDVPLTPVIEEPATVRIEIGVYGFEPPLVTVPVGAVIEWVNVDVVAHSATRLPATGMVLTSATEPAWDSGRLTPGQSYKTRVTGAGVFDYGDRINPENSGTIVVETNRLMLPTIQR